MWTYTILIFLAFLKAIDAAPQWIQQPDNFLPPLPPMYNNPSSTFYNFPTRQQVIQPWPSTSTSDILYEPIGIDQNTWPNRPISPRRQPSYRMDSLNEGMQKEVWNNWLPNNGYGFHLGSRPELGKGGWVARQTFAQAQSGSP